GGGARLGRRQLWLGSVGSGEPLSAATNSFGSADCPDLRRRGLDRHPAYPAPPPLAQHQTAPASSRPKAAQEGEVPGRMGQPAERHQHLLLPARRSGGGRLRTFSEEEGEEHPF